MFFFNLKADSKMKKIISLSLITFISFFIPQNQLFSQNGNVEIEGHLQITGQDISLKNAITGSEFLFHNQWQNLPDGNWLQIAPGDGNGNWNFDRALRLEDGGELVKRIDSGSKTAFAVSLNGENNFQVMGDGKVYARDVEVSLDQFPDYVFDEDYELLTLEQVKQFITTEKHLPNVPSAKEVEENGYSLKELNLKQMEKIEELTLYILQMNDQIIQTNKRLEKLENENKELKKVLPKND